MDSIIEKKIRDTEKEIADLKAEFLVNAEALKKFKGSKAERAVLFEEKGQIQADLKEAQLELDHLNDPNNHEQILKLEAETETDYNDIDHHIATDTTSDQVDAAMQNHETTTEENSHAQEETPAAIENTSNPETDHH